MFMQWIAMAAPAGGEGGQQQSPGLMIGWIVFMVLIFYFLMIRPQKRREKERRSLIESVKSGSQVVLTSGIVGKITNTKEKTLIIKTADDTKLEVLRSAVAQVVEDKSAIQEDVK